MAKLSTACGFTKEGKYGCFVLINKWCSWVQSALGAIQLYVQSGSDEFEELFVVTKLSYYFYHYHSTFERQKTIKRRFPIFWFDKETRMTSNECSQHVLLPSIT